jgi:hypothetical protein
MDYKIKKGYKLLCIKELILDTTKGAFYFYKGDVYTSNKDGHITDNFGNEKFAIHSSFFDYFEIINTSTSFGDIDEISQTTGVKESDGKLNIEYDWDFLKAQMNRMAKNKSKYPKYNWQKPMDIQQLKDALFRHTLEVMNDNFDDDGDDLGHLSAIALNSMFIFNNLFKTKKQ